MIKVVTVVVKIQKLVGVKETVPMMLVALGAVRVTLVAVQVGVARAIAGDVMVEDPGLVQEQPKR